MIFHINEQNPQMRLVDKCIEILKKDGIIIYPTDTVYAFGCDIESRAAIEKLYRIKNIDRNQPLSFIFSDISQISDYTRNISNNAFKIMKKTLPGPYTYIFQASKLVPKIVLTKQKTVGVRIPDNNVAQAIVNRLGRPILSSSLNESGDDFSIDPESLELKLRNMVDVVIDSGKKIQELSTIVDFSSGDPVIIRSGHGKFDF
ncbi:MAG: threonylcarbamoyl-AMP synthase [Spirochaetes bacterium]|nr:threonylcarbamoyl-AMP synthase [Spirochaetota bacterium]